MQLDDRVKSLRKKIRQRPALASASTPAPEPKQESTAGTEALVSTALKTIQDSNKAVLDSMQSQLDALRTDAQQPVQSMERMLQTVVQALAANTAAMEKIANLKVDVTVPAPKAVAKKTGPRKVSMNLGNRVLTAEITGD